MANSIQIMTAINLVALLAYSPWVKCVPIAPGLEN